MKIPRRVVLKLTGTLSLLRVTAMTGAAALLEACSAGSPTYGNYGNYGYGYGGRYGQLTPAPKHDMQPRVIPVREA
jgi:hypothetical protein